MNDSSGNSIRFYKVIYERSLATGDRIRCTSEAMAENQLKSMLYDFDSRYKYLVLSATYLPNFAGNESTDGE